MTAVTITQISPPELEALINSAVNKALSAIRPEAPIPDRGYLTRSQVCECLHISMPTLHSWIKQGKLMSYHIGGRTLFKESEVFGAVQAVSYSIANKKG
jgi:excisionase family DNA binding protein